jgi:hypothetical protein
MDMGGGDERRLAAERLGGGGHHLDRLVVAPGGEQRDPDKPGVPVGVMGLQSQGRRPSSTATSCSPMSAMPNEA